MTLSHDCSARLVPLLFTLQLGTACDPDDDAPPAVDGGEELGPEYAEVDSECDLDNLADSAPFIGCVESFEPAPGVSFGHSAMPMVIMGPPLGGGPMMGSTDVVSLGCGGSITLAFDEGALRDIEGPDFIVFENPFQAGSITFIEPAAVFVSDDGAHWRSFPCSLSGDGSEPSGNCAGLRPVEATDEQTARMVDVAGGDAFDLAQVGLTRASYIRIVDRTEEHYGDQIWCEGAGGGFDLDAVITLGDQP